MLDGLILQAVLVALVTIAVIFTTVWFIGGLTQKNAVWIIALGVPLALFIAVAVAILSG